jgi:beta-glucosidase
VVAVYLTQPKGYETPIRVLAGFTRVHLAPGASSHVGLTIDPRSLSQVDEAGNHVILTGEYVVSVGETSPQTATFTVAGKAEEPK